jgi:hypothetical protein
MLRCEQCDTSTALRGEWSPLFLFSYHSLFQCLIFRARAPDSTSYQSPTVRSFTFIQHEPKKKKKKKKIVLTFVCFSVVARPTNNGSYYRACDNVEGTENCTVVLGRFVDCFGASRRARKLQIAFLKLVRRLSKWCPTRHALCAQQLSSSFAGRCRRQRS